MLVRWRLRLARSWWALGLVVGVIAMWLLWRYGEGWIALIGAGGFVLGLIVLLIVVTVRRDEVMDDVIDDLDLDDGHGDGYDGDQ
ncbi:MAG: hypothetical protein ACI85K_001438 [Hyphomicrobiaceae bacterium]|jgi:hypothetical protein